MDFSSLQAHGSSLLSAASTISAARSCTALCGSCRCDTVLSCSSGSARSTPDAAKEVMKTHDAIFSTRPLSFAAKMATKDRLGIVRAPYGDHWRQLRKICTMGLLNSRRVQSLRPAREEEALRLVQAVSSSSTAAAPLVDLGKLVAVYVADASLRAILGRRFKVNDRDTLLHYLDEGVRLAGGFTPRDLFPSSWLARVIATSRVEYG